MKCPKCGYNTFETSDFCRKCSNDLSEFKRSFNIAPIVMPESMVENLAATIGPGPAVTKAASSEPAGDMFSFDLPTENSSAAPAAAEKPADPFSFGDIQAAPAAAPSPFSFDAPPASSTAHDPFAELLEQTPTGGPSAKQTTDAAPAQAPQFELNSFSWDDSAEAENKSDSASKPANKASGDDFNSLFGDLNSPDK